MKRRSFLAMIGMAPLVATAKPAKIERPIPADALMRTETDGPITRITHLDVQRARITSHKVMEYNSETGKIYIRDAYFAA